MSMGVLAPVSAQAQHFAQPPIDTSGKSVIQVFPNPSEVIPKIQNPRTAFENNISAN